MLNQLKKNYAIITQAISMLKAEHDGIDPVQMPFVVQKFGHPTYLDVGKFAEAITKYLPSVYDKEDRERKMCFSDPSKFNIKTLHGSRYNPTPFSDNLNHTWQLNNGACISFHYGSGWDWNDGVNHTFIIDVNGSDKNPNSIGKDIFFFVLMPDGRLLPYGHERSADDFAAWWSGCRTDGKGDGYGCSRLIMEAGWTFPKDYPWKK